MNDEEIKKIVHRERSLKPLDDGWLFTQEQVKQCMQKARADERKNYQEFAYYCGLCCCILEMPCFKDGKCPECGNDKLEILYRKKEAQAQPSEDKHFIDYDTGGNYCSDKDGETKTFEPAENPRKRCKCEHLHDEWNTDLPCKVCGCGEFEPADKGQVEE